jgi:cytochrome P450
VSVGVGFDPFEAGFDAWPYDQYRRLREADPVHWSELLSGWVLTRFEDVSHVLRDHSVSSDLDKAKPSPVVDLLRARSGPNHAERDGMTLVLVDDPEHARLRKLLQAPFTARSIERLRTDVQARVDAHLDRLGSSGPAELIAAFAYPLPVEVFCDMLGIPAEEGPRFRAWTAAVARSLDVVISEEDYDACMVLLEEMEQYLSDIADAKRAAPDDRVLSALLAAEVDGQRLTHGELVPQLITLYVAGHEPTTALIGNGLVALFAHPEQLAALQADPTLVPDAVLELLRYDGPNQFVRRVATTEMVIGDRSIGEGDVLYLCVGAANHDPERWGDDADSLRIDRPEAGMHVQFGGGIHHCLGAHLARLQAEVALTSMFARLTDLRPAGEPTWAGRTTLRSVTAVPIDYG